MKRTVSPDETLGFGHDPSFVNYQIHQLSPDQNPLEFIQQIDRDAPTRALAPVNRAIKSGELQADLSREERIRQLGAQKKSKNQRTAEWKQREQKVRAQYMEPSPTSSYPLWVPEYNATQFDKFQQTHGGSWQDFEKFRSVTEHDSLKFPTGWDKPVEPPPLGPAPEVDYADPQVLNEHFKMWADSQPGSARWLIAHARDKFLLSHPDFGKAARNAGWQSEVLQHILPRDGGGAGEDGQ